MRTDKLFELLRRFLPHPSPPLIKGREPEKAPLDKGSWGNTVLLIDSLVKIAPCLVSLNLEVPSRARTAKSPKIGGWGADPLA